MRMRTISLRTLFREPLKVKRMTRAGKSVQVTDNRQPLWILQPADGSDHIIHPLVEECPPEVFRKSRIPLRAPAFL
jgi:hypothetical protein